ncbi:inositol 1,4,5-trisphosphate receptor-interacting protein-like 2 [Thamnophis elegans]|uniref:inositol 1,4,5-trisphosphate receptor-interacting protein-like 2 n=1 Tax=Thamnophis elegans TaxID=35005 RepID=UPI001376FC17|nr:inositol 1,4,5-trisphosphate receptor-interacting protein-like 2 [Thamnophis elegans]
MAVYSLHGRVFWPLLTGACTLLLCLLQTLRGQAGPTDGEAGWPSGLRELPLPVPLLLVVVLVVVLLAALGLGRRAWWTARRRQRQRAAQRSPGACGGREARRRALLDGFYETRLRLSPHVLGHSKAHVSLVVGELLRAGKAAGRLSLRGDAVQVGSAYEQHKVGSPDGFDVLLPLRLPPGLELRALPCGTEDQQQQQQRQPGARGVFLCALRVVEGGQGSPSRALCVAAGPGEADGASLLSAALVARWFQAQVQRCLGAVRARLQERCRVRLAVGVAAPCPLALEIVPCSDYVCCHLSLTVHLTPAIPLGEGLYLTPRVCCPQRSAAPQLGTFWTLNLSKAEQRFLAWLRDQVPADSCHLRCLQILKGLRELGGRALETPWAAQWDRILSSYVLKTALFWVLLHSPWQAWEDQFLVARLEDVVLFLVQALQRGRLAHLFLGNPHLPEILSLPKFVKEASPVNLLADFDRPALEKVASQLLSIWKQAPRIIRMYGSHRYRKQHLT